MVSELMLIDGGVTSAKGFFAAGQHIGLRRHRKDLALLLSATESACAAVFTTNIMKGAPVIWNKQVLARRDTVRAVVVNSACANAGTGLAGLLHAGLMAEITADCFGITSEGVLVASTGLIGVPLPIDVLRRGIPMSAGRLCSTRAAANDAAQAITTTDTFTKEIALELIIDGKIVTLGGMAKGSGMVHPNMATTLAFICTDLAIAPSLLNKALKAAVEQSFNMISVDGDTSTNDMVIVLANGMAGNAIIDAECAEYDLFLSGLCTLTRHLAKSVARDGEGATKLIEVAVSGAQSSSEAAKLARAVVSSNLVKTAVFAADANWGRILAALGTAGVPVQPHLLSITLRGQGLCLPLLIDGIATAVNEHECTAAFKGGEVHFDIVVGSGDARATAWGCDLTYDYITRSGKYRADRNSSAIAGLVKEETVA